MEIQFRQPKEEEISLLVEIGESSGIFTSGEADDLLGQTLVDEKLPLKHQAHVVVHENSIKGWVYFGPIVDSTVLNLYWIGVEPRSHGKGFGRKFLSFVDETARSEGGTELMIETSSGSLLNRTRNFYKLQRYTVSQSKTEYDGYGHGEDKIVFEKQL